MMCLVVFLAVSGTARPACNVIPSATGAFRGALGSPLRPFAAPGESVTLRFRPNCPATGFLPTAQEHNVTVVFTPPNAAARNVVVLSPSCTGIASALSTCQGTPDVASVNCVTVDPMSDPDSLSVFELPPPSNERRLSFRFPDTDGLVGTLGDGRTLTGPAAIAVTAFADDLPCGLASEPCRNVGGTIACIDELFDVDGTCRTDPALVERTFPHFTALPPANDYQAVCTPAGPVCTGTQNHVRMTVDAGGNLLFPVDWRGILVNAPQPPVPRLLRASTSLPAFGTGSPIRVPSRAFLGSFTPEGVILPPIFEPQFDPGAAAELALFGSADAPYTILRVARRGPDLRVCSGGGNDGRPCAGDADCPSGTCTTATCVGGSNPGTPCTNDVQCLGGGECGAGLFDLSGLLQSGVGPIVLNRLSAAGVCDDGTNAGLPCPANACPGSACVNYRARAGIPVPLDSLFASDRLFAFGASELLAGSDLNGDLDANDGTVVIPIDRATGLNEGQCSGSGAGCESVSACPVGQTCRAVQRGVSRVVDPCSDVAAFPAIDLESNVLAFLEPEATAINADGNADGDRVDTLLRVFNFDVAGNPEVTASTPIPVDAGRPVNGGGVAISGGQVFYRRTEAGGAPHLTQRVSVDTGGGDPNGASGTLGRVGVSRDGHYVVFASTASDLVSGDTNGVADVFLWDRWSQTMERVSVGDPSGEGNGASYNPSISADGNIIVFESNATNLTGDAISMGPNVFRRNRGLSQTLLLTGAPGFGSVGGTNPIIDDDGVVIAFTSSFPYDVMDTNFVADVYYAIQPLASIFRASAPLGGASANGASGLNGVSVLVNPPNIVPNIRAYFASDASNFLLGDANGVSDIYLGRDYVGGSSVPPISTGVPARIADGPNTFPSAGETVCRDAIAYQRGTSPSQIEVTLGTVACKYGTLAGCSDSDTTLLGTMSVDSFGTPGNLGSTTPAMSRNALFVAFASQATNLGSDFTAGNDVFVHDVTTGATLRASAGNFGGGNGASDKPAISGNGSVVAFRSDATDLVAGDGNGLSDVFTYAPDPMATASDITGDGQIDDVVLERLDPATGVRTPICPASAAAVAAGTAVFLRPASAGATPSLSCPGVAAGNSDYIHLAPLVGAVQNLGHLGNAVAISAACIGGSRAGAGCDTVADCPGGSCTPAWVAASIPENYPANGVNDTLLGVHAIADPPTTWTILPATVSPSDLFHPGIIAVAGSLVAFASDEGTENPGGGIPFGADFNDDGDFGDRTLRIYDAASGTGMPTDFPYAVQFADLGQPEVIDCGSGPHVEQLLAFTVPEGSQSNTPGGSLNGDADPDDNVLFVYDVRSGLTTPVGQAVSNCTIPGCNTFKGFAIANHRVRFLTKESDQDAILNSDGDTDDYVIQVWDGCTKTARVIGTAGTGDPLRPPTDPVGAYSDPAGRCKQGATLLLSPGSCRTDDDCPASATCVAANVTIGESDTDADDIPDALDNCPSVANTGQIDADADEVGDACDLAVCGNGMIELDEGCDDGNPTGGDGCSAACQAEPHMIRGKKMLVKDPSGYEQNRSIVVLGKESGLYLDLGLAFGNPVQNGATLRVIAKGVEHYDETFVLDPSGWTYTPTGYLYAGPTEADGDPVKKLIVRRSLLGGKALLKVIIRGNLGTQPVDIEPPLGVADGGIILTINGGGVYCVGFGGAAGGSDPLNSGRVWKIVNPTGKACPVP